MSIRVMSAVFESGLPPNLKLVAAVFGDQADDDGYAVPGKARLARKSSFSTRQVDRIMVELEEVCIERVPLDQLPPAVRAAWEALPGNRKTIPRRLHVSRLPGMTDRHPKPSEDASGAAPQLIPTPKPAGATDRHPTGETPVSPHEAGRGDIHDTVGVTPMSPNPLIENSKTPLTTFGARHLPRPRVLHPVIQEIIEGTIVDDRHHLLRELVHRGWVESETQPWKFTDPHGAGHDLIWEAVLVVSDINPADLTVKARKSLNVAVEEIRAVAPGPVEVLVRGRRGWRAKRRRPTPHELSQKWAEWGPGADTVVNLGDIRAREAADRIEEILAEGGAG